MVGEGMDGRGMVGEGMDGRGMDGEGMVGRGMVGRGMVRRQQLELGVPQGFALATVDRYVDGDLPVRNYQNGKRFGASRIFWEKLA